MRSETRIPVRPLAALLLAGALMGNQKCDDNLGDVSPGPTSFRISISPGQVNASADSDSPSWSADGRYVCFSSRATNLASPNSPFSEVFIRDRMLDEVVNVTKLSKTPFSNPAADALHPHMSPNGRFIVFECAKELTYDPADMPPKDAFQNHVNIFWIDREAAVPGISRMEGDLDGDCLSPIVSNDGKIAFVTDAPAVSVDLTNPISFPPINNPGGWRQVYVYDLLNFTYSLISHQSADPTAPGDRHSDLPRISSDGTAVVFQSFSHDLTVDDGNPNLPAQSTGARRIYWAASDGTGLTLASRATGAAGLEADNHCTSPNVSADGRYVVFLYQGGAMIPGTTGLASCVVRRDMNPASFATDLAATDAFLFAIFIPYAAGDSTGISADGRYLAYTGSNTGNISTATDLAIRVKDMLGGNITASRHILTSTSSLDVFPGTALSEDGRWVAWRGDSDAEVIGDTNRVPDVFGYGAIH